MRIYFFCCIFILSLWSCAPVPALVQNSKDSVSLKLPKLDLALAYENWKSRFVTSEGANHYLRVRREKDETVSEGMGYGMLFAVAMDDTSTFDLLWKYAKNYHNQRGLMNWKISGDGVVIGENAATDADEDMAFALVLADRKWGGYKKDAMALIQNIYAYCVEYKTNVLKPGDHWGGSKITNPSYFAPAYYRVFSEYTNEKGWLNCLNTSYKIMSRILRHTAAKETGLMPDWCDSNGMPVEKFSYSYTYDAVRVPIRLAMDALWFKEKRAIDILRLQASFWQRIPPKKIKDGYSLSGILSGKYHNNCFVAPAAVTSLFSQNSAWRKEIWNETVRLKNDRYFQDSLRLFSLLLAKGNFL